MLPPEISAWLQEWIWLVLFLITLAILVKKFGLGKLWRWTIFGIFVFGTIMVLRWKSRVSSSISEWKSSFMEAARQEEWEEVTHLLEQDSLPGEEKTYFRDFYERMKALDNKIKTLERTAHRDTDRDTSLAPIVPATTFPTKTPELSAAQHFQNGLKWQDQGQPQRTLQQFGQTLTVEALSAADHYAQGVVYAELEEYPKALDSYEQALKIRPDFAAVYNRRAMIYEELGFFDKALDDYFSAVALDPRLVSTYVNRGGLYQKTGRWFEALMDYNMALDLKAPNQEILLRRVALLEKMVRKQR